MADAFFLPAVLTLGVVSTLQDFRVRRISNLWIILSLAYAASVHLYLFLCADPQETAWFLQSLINVLASALVAIYFWKQNWWGGGDAKLFVCYAALIPLAHYPFGYFAYYFASFLLLIMTFVPAAIWTFLHAQFSLIKAGKNAHAGFRIARVGEFFQISFGFTAVFFLWNLIILAFDQYVPWVRDFPIMIWLLGMGYYATILRSFQERPWLVMVVWMAGAGVIVSVPFFHQVNAWHLLINSVISWLLLFVLRRYMLKTIDYYVEWTKNNHMAFAGWMFLAALAMWFYKIIF